MDVWEKTPYWSGPSGAARGWPIYQYWKFGKENIAIDMIVGTSITALLEVFMPLVCQQSI